MKAAEVVYSDRELKTQIRQFKGINRRNSAADGEWTHSRNVTTDAYPALQTRPGRSRYGEWTTATDLYLCNGHEFVVADAKLYMDGTELTAVTPGQKQWALVNTQLVIWPDKIIVDVNTGAVTQMEQDITANISIGSSGFLSISVTGRTGSFDLTYKLQNVYVTNAGAEPWLLETRKNEFYMWRYTGLRKEQGQYRWNSHSYAAVESGAYFIGQRPRTKEKDILSDTPPTDTEITTGTLPYGQITGVQILSEASERWNWGYWEEYPGYEGYVEETTTRKRYTFQLYDTGTGLGDNFEIGDTVKLSGCVLLYNNRDLLVKDINQSGMQVDGVIGSAQYYTLSQSYGAGIYKVGSRYYDVTTSMRTGQQLFTYGISYVLYLYDPVTEELLQYEPMSGTPTPIATIVMNTYNGGAAASMTLTREVPDMDFICHHGNRLYGVSNREESRIYDPQSGQYLTITARVLHASELGKPNRWNTYRGTSLDSYSVAIGGSGDFTAMCEYSNSVLAWKEDKLYRLSGEYPAEFYLRDYYLDGVKAGCHRSLCTINELLYYVSPCGVMAYSGGVPNLISYTLGMGYVSGAQAGRDRIHYFLCVSRPDGESEFFCYDTVHGAWTLTSDETVTAICRNAERALLIIGGKIYQTDGGDDALLVWEAELAETDEQTDLKKRYRFIRMTADVQGTMTVEYRANDNDWQELGEITVSGKKVHTFPADTIRADRMTLRLSGTGKCTVYNIEREFTMGSDR